MSSQTTNPLPTSPNETTPSTNNDWTSSFFKQADMGRRYKNAEIATGPFARTMIEKSGLLTSTEDHLTILDNACGTGVVAAALHEVLGSEVKEKMELTCGDFSEPMLEAVRERMGKEGWVNTEARMVDAMKTGLEDESFTHVLANFVIMGLQEPDAALGECHRILKPGGTLAFTTWHHVSWINDVRAAFATLPGPPPFPDDITMYRSWGGQGDWHSVDWIRSHLTNPTSNPDPTKENTYKFTDIQVEEIGKELSMPTPEAFVDTFSVMIPFILKKFWSERERKELGEIVVPALLRYMEEKYGKGGEVRLWWVANVAVMRKAVE
ncbi:MAG: hypothetical protein Q9170_006067 [Blastenia crenularia]